MNAYGSTWAHNLQADNIRTHRAEVRQWPFGLDEDGIGRLFELIDKCIIVMKVKL